MTPDDGQKTCPKHVEFYFKNKFEKLVHLVGFIIRIYHTHFRTTLIYTTVASIAQLHASTKLLLLVVGNKMHSTGLSSNDTHSYQVS